MATATKTAAKPETHAREMTGAEMVVQALKEKDDLWAAQYAKALVAIRQNRLSEAEETLKEGKKKKGVELVLDEELGEVVGRKKHKRGEDDVLGIDE